MPAWVIRPNALTNTDLATLWADLSASPFVGPSPLAGVFAASRGFALVFRRDGLSELARRFPALVPFLDLVLEPETWATLEKPWERWWRRALPNAFYLNLLLVPPAAGVGPHLDATLRAELGDDRLVPRIVSVLYLEVPSALRGGELVLRRGRRELGRIAPAVGSIVHFRGELLHEVRPLGAADSEAPTKAVRASLVCEQYVLSSAQLLAVPAFRIHSKQGFTAYLADAEQRPTPRLELDNPEVLGAAPGPDELPR